jgi:hypothetical protein
MLPEVIKKRIEHKYAKEIRYSKDCEVLARMISIATKEKISVTTLLRLFGFTKCKNENHRLYTLDIIAKYIGFSCWNEAINNGNMNDDTSYIEGIDKVAFNNLEEGQVITLFYNTGLLLKLKFLGPFMFEVVHTEKSNLKLGDVLNVLRLDLTHPLICEKVIRSGKNMGPFEGGENGVIIKIKIEI